jgi:putative ABC transport system permease protein
LADALRSTPGVDVVTEARISPAIVDGEANDLFTAFDATTVADTFELGSVTGDLASLGTDGLAVSADTATDHAWTIGSAVPASFPGGNSTLHVKAIYTGATDWVGSMFVDLDALRAKGGDDFDFRVYVSGNEDAIKQVASNYASAHVLDKQGFLDVVNKEIDTMLMMFYALLGLAVVIALLGIANTLALSIFERTREVGLLRAVGMGRSQIRSTVRWESIIIAVFGTTLGLAIGTFFGWAIVEALADEGIDTLTVPGTSLAVITVIAGLAGAIAAVVPARRAARLDVLKAIVAD